MYNFGWETKLEKQAKDIFYPAPAIYTVAYFGALEFLGSALKTRPFIDLFWYWAF